MYFRLFFSWTQTLWTLIRLLLKDQSNLGPYCLQYRLHMKEQTKLTGGICQKYEINSIRKNNHNSLPTLYSSRQTHTFNHRWWTFEWTDRRTDGNYPSSCFRLYHVIHWIFYMFERKPIAFASIIWQFVFFWQTVCFIVKPVTFCTNSIIRKYPKIAVNLHSG